MTHMIDITIQDQSDRIQQVKALLHVYPEGSAAQQLKLEQRIDHIVVDGEIIQPSIQLLYESKTTPNIYKIVE